MTRREISKLFSCDMLRLLQHRKNAAEILIWKRWILNLQQEKIMDLYYFEEY